MSYSKQNTKRKQALESAQYALEIINLVPRAHVSIGQHKASTNRHVGSGNEIGKSSVKENRTQLHLSFVQGFSFISAMDAYYLQQDILILGITLLTLL